MIRGVSLTGYATKLKSIQYIIFNIYKKNRCSLNVCFLDQAIIFTGHLNYF